MNNIEKLAIEHSENCFRHSDTGELVCIEFNLQGLEAFAKAYAQQSSEPVADYTPNKDCTMCNGGGLYCVGYSGSESDGNAPILERCECYLDNIAPPASVPLEKYNKLLDALKRIASETQDTNLLWWQKEARQAIAEAEGKD